MKPVPRPVMSPPLLGRTFLRLPCRPAGAGGLWPLFLVFLLLLANSLKAQEASEIEQLKQQLREMQENFERVQRQQREQIEALTRKLNELSKQQTAETEKAKLEQELASELSSNQPPATAQAPTAAPTSSWSAAAPITVARAGSAYMNISFDALINAGWSTASDPSEYLELGDHDPIKRGFSLRNAEIALDGAVDPYFKGFASLLFKLNEDNETDVELEETYLQTTALPANLQVKAGQFFANFG
ncbi:MAG TPA: hypothetical protein VEC99_03700, partial [Clostridia bacterium]|nr:hypothetical protein [Clostridia bacterium]